MKIAFVADNSGWSNWGCRATTYALAELLEQRHEIVSTLTRATIAEPVTRTRLVPPRIFNAGLSRIAKGARLAGRAGPAMAETLLRPLGRQYPLGHDMDANVALLETMASTGGKAARIMDAINAADAVVINGEGEMIFATPARPTLLHTMAIAELARRHGKPTFYLNGMVSSCPESGENPDTLELARSVLKGIHLAVRDPLSLAYAQDRFPGSRPDYFPDALFSWSRPHLADETRSAQPGLRALFDRTGFRAPKSIVGPYIMLSGSSTAAKKPDLARVRYLALARALQTAGLPLLIVPTCDGDAFLEDVAREAGADFLPVGIPISLGAALLERAAAFVSGRWHPAIMAANGGTPLIMLGSNSHKTRALIDMLPYPHSREFNALPDDDDIRNIVDQLRKELAGRSERRRELAAAAFRLGEQARQIGEYVRGP